MTIMKRLLGALALGSLLVAAPASAGEITQADGEFGWTTACPRPVAPVIVPGSPGRQDLMLAFSRDIERFIACMQVEAQADLDRATREMHEAVQTMVQFEVDRANDQMSRVVRDSR